jgi:hypothetical protein
MQKSQCLFTIADQAHAAADMPMIEDLHRRPGVQEIVLDQEDFHGPANDRSAENALSHELQEHAHGVPSDAEYRATRALLQAKS